MNGIFRHHYRLAAVIGLGILICAAVCLLPVKIPCEVSAVGRLMPCRKWVLARADNGALMSTLIDYRSGRVKDQAVFRFSGDGISTFCARQRQDRCRSLCAGDTIGYIRSSALEESLASLDRELVDARAALLADSSGDKREAIREHEQELAYARAEASLERQILVRLKELYERDLISALEYEQAEGNVNLLDQAVEIARARLDNARSGRKPTLLDLDRARVDALCREVATVRQRASAFTLVCPISGCLTQPGSPDTLITVEDTTGTVSVVLIKASDRHRIPLHTSVKVRSGIDGSAGSGTIRQVGNNTHLVNGEAVVTAVVDMAEMPDSWGVGITTRCEITAYPMTALEWFHYFTVSMGM
ncbi:MAG: hypothetical protein KKA42_12645 [candidate division Zixibacteria bacterium]|nr:hypothetical protein [candidate division Zixibacteria bacterium]